MSGQIVVFLATRLAVLEHRDTRWGAVLREWARAADRQLHVVDFPRFSRRPRSPLGASASWLPGTQAWDVTFPATSAEWHAHDPLVARGVGRLLVRRLQLGSRDALVSTSPLWSELLAATGLRWSFDAVDDWRDLPSSAGYPRRVERGYRLLRGANALTAVSPDLATRLATFTPLPIEPVANGVDVERFEFASRSTASTTLALPDRPFAVYVGHVHHLDRVSLDHMRATTAAGVPVVLAGEAEPSVVDRLRAAGVTYIGPVRRAELPELLSAARVGIVPHLDTPLTRSMDAMKTLEYLAAGLPVVVTPVAARPDYADRVIVAEGPEQFAAATRAALDEPKALPRQALRTWADVAADLWRIHVAT